LKVIFEVQTRATTTAIAAILAVIATIIIIACSVSSSVRVNHDSE
jgi:hypothetical protein